MELGQKHKSIRTSHVSTGFLVIIVFALLLFSGGLFLSNYVFASAFSPNGTSGSQVTLTSPKPQSSGEFGDSIATSSKFIVVGAPGETAGGQSSAGRVYVFSAKSDKLVASFSSPNAQRLGEFGWSVAVSGNLVAVGAPYETVGPFFHGGHTFSTL